MELSGSKPTLSRKRRGNASAASDAIFATANKSGCRMDEQRRKTASDILLIPFRLNLAMTVGIISISKAVLVTCCKN